MWPFRRKQAPSPEELAAEARLDEATREVAVEELDKEAAREAASATLAAATLGGAGNPAAPLASLGAMPGTRRERDPDPGDEEGLRDVLGEGDEKR